MTNTPPLPGAHLVEQKLDSIAERIAKLHSLDEDRVLSESAEILTELESQLDKLKS